MKAMSIIMFRALTDNARYTKLRRQVWELKFIVKKAVDIPSGHLRTLARFKIIFNEIICGEKIVQILRSTFCRISSQTQYVSIAPAAMGSQPCFSGVWANIRHENVTLAISGHCPRRRLVQCRVNAIKMGSHIVGRNIILRVNIRHGNPFSNLRGYFINSHWFYK